MDLALLSNSLVAPVSEIHFQRLSVRIRVQDELRTVCKLLGSREKPAGRLAILLQSFFLVLGSCGKFIWICLFP